MVTAHLEDLTEGRLRGIATELGIPDAANLKKAELIAAIREKVSPGGGTVTLSVSAAEQKGWKSASVTTSLIAVVVAAAACVANWIGSYSSYSKLSHDVDQERAYVEEERKRDWRAVRMFDLIVTETNSAEKWHGLTFEEIRARYSDEVAAEQNLHLGKKDLQPDEIRRILMDLMRSQLVFRTVDNRYIPSRTPSQSWDCSKRPASDETERAILKVLESESGKYTAEKLGAKVRANSKISSEDYFVALNCMKSRGLIVVDSATQIVGTALDPPKMTVPVTMPKDEKK